MGLGRDPALDLLEREGGYQVGAEGDGGARSVFVDGLFDDGSKGRDTTPEDPNGGEIRSEHWVSLIIRRKM